MHEPQNSTSASTVKLSRSPSSAVEITRSSTNLRHLPISSKEVAAPRGLSTSKAPKGSVQGETHTEHWERSCEYPKVNRKCNRVSGCHRRCESSEKLNAWWLRS